MMACSPSDQEEMTPMDMIAVLEDVGTCHFMTSII